MMPALIIILVLAAGMVYFFLSVKTEQKANEEMVRLAEIDKKEMENQYQDFANQYGEMMTKVDNDSLVAQLTKEQLRTQELLKELRQTKASDAETIAKLKAELADVRAVLRQYVVTIDSLNRLNENLTAENTKIRGDLEESNRKLEESNAQNTSLSEKMAIAAQLDAFNINLTPLGRNGRPEKRVSRAKQLKVDFRVAKNVSATNGIKTFYVRITTPTGSVLSIGTFPYENRNLQYSIRKSAEYGGNEIGLSTYWNIREVHSAGTYQVAIFCDGQMIGSRSIQVS